MYIVPDVPSTSEKYTLLIRFKAALQICDNLHLIGNFQIATAALTIIFYAACLIEVKPCIASNPYFKRPVIKASRVNP